MIMIRAKINEIETRKTIGRSTKQRVDFLKDKINKSLAFLRKKENIEVNKMSNERRDITGKTTKNTKNYKRLLWTIT